jgi:peptidoglycan/xylan/chitin deacetylase (PgdA/CDA1 family)
LDNVVLCYHALSHRWDADLSTTPARFTGQVAFLLKRGYRPARFSDVVRAPMRSGLLSVTFDDAFRSVFTEAAPILARLGVPGTLFVPTDYIDSGGPLAWDGIDHWLDGSSASELQPMSWDEIRQLATAGWEIGSHTASHPRLTSVSDKQLADELTQSKAVCERELEAPCTSIAYPYGDLDASVVASAGAAGYTTAASLPSVFQFGDPLQWPRIGVYHLDDDRRFRLKVSLAMMRLRRTGVWNAVKAAQGTAWSRYKLGRAVGREDRTT